MPTRLRRPLLALAAAVVTGFAFAAIPVSAATAPRVLDVTTALDSRPFGGSEFIAGEMHLAIAPDGIVQGWYRPETDPSRIAMISGGLTGSTIVLDVGNPPTFHISGALRRRGSITGTTAIGNQTYRFTAMPRKT